MTIVTTRRRPRVRDADATRRRILDATIETLVRRGYPATTTMEVQRTAGVSRGALLHHFPTRAKLVVAALFDLARRQAEQFDGPAREAPGDDRDRIDRVLDLLWSASSSPLFEAPAELARLSEDPDLGPWTCEEMLRFDPPAQYTSRQVTSEREFGGRAIPGLSLRGPVELPVRLRPGVALAGAR